MFANKFFILFVTGTLILTACMRPAPQNPGQNNAGQPQQSQDSGQPVATDAAASSVEETHAGADHHSEVDLTHLEVGDGKYSTSPQVGYVYSCMTSFNGGGAQVTGPWMNGDGTWDATKKAVIDGSVTWPSSSQFPFKGINESSRATICLTTRLAITPLTQATMRIHMIAIPIPFKRNPLL